MVFRDGGGGTGSLGGLAFGAYGAVGAWAAVAMSPANADRIPQLNPTLQALISSSSPPAALQWQVSAVSNFASTVWTGTDSAIPDGVQVHVVTTALTDQTQYWWRVRAGDGAGTWGAWSSATFIVDTNAGRGYAEVYLSTGIDQTALSGFGSSGTYLNTAAPYQLKDYGVTPLYENVNFGDLRQSFEVQPMYWGDVSVNTPTPHLWWLLPNGGRDGDGIRIVGFGLGDLQTTFSGVVEVYKGAVLGWVTVAVTAWQAYPASANAYLSGRLIDEHVPVIDPQHQIVDIVVPAGSVPPGYPLRIRTNGP